MTSTSSKKSFIVNDIIAGLTTSFAAIALGAAFGVQSGRGAFAGMVSAALIPIITSLFGGTRLQASGPTAPMTAVMVLIIASAYSTFGEGSSNAEGFITIVMLLTAILLSLAGLFKLGKIITYVPNVVILGFMNGIAVLIWWDQIKKLFGLGGGVKLIGETWQNVLLAIITFFTILIFPTLLKKLKIPEKIRPFIPGTLVTIIAGTYFVVFNDLNLETVKLGSSVSNFGEFFGLVGKYWPSSSLLTMEIILKALPFALQLTVLAYLDSLLTSLVIDKITGEKTQKNKELIAQGLANGVAGLFGGIAGAQATIRSVILLKEGAKTRFAGVMVGVFALLGALVFKDLIVLVASSIFIGVLFKAGLDVFEKDFFKDYFKKQGFKDKNWNWQLGFVLYTTVVTVVADLNIAVFSGTAFFYLAKYYLKIKDADQEEETSVGSEA